MHHITITAIISPKLISLRYNAIKALNIVHGNLEPERITASTQISKGYHLYSYSHTTPCTNAELIKSRVENVYIRLDQENRKNAITD